VHTEIAIIAWKISKIAATKCHIVRMKSAIPLGLTPMGELTALPKPLAAFKGYSLLLMGGEGK